MVSIGRRIATRFHIGSYQGSTDMEICNVGMYFYEKKNISIWLVLINYWTQALCYFRRGVKLLILRSMYAVFWWYFMRGVTLEHSISSMEWRSCLFSCLIVWNVEINTKLEALQSTLIFVIIRYKISLFSRIILHFFKSNVNMLSRTRSILCSSIGMFNTPCLFSFCNQLFLMSLLTLFSIIGTARMILNIMTLA